MECRRSGSCGSDCCRLSLRAFLADPTAQPPSRAKIANAENSQRQARAKDVILAPERRCDDPGAMPSQRLRMMSVGIYGMAANQIYGSQSNFQDEPFDWLRERLVAPKAPLLHAAWVGRTLVLKCQPWVHAEVKMWERMHGRGSGWALEETQGATTSFA